MSKRKSSGRKKSSSASIVSQSLSPATSNNRTKLSASNELSRLGLQSATQATAIRFGSPAASKQRNSSGSEGLFSNLVKSSASNGVKSLLSGGLLGLFGGSIFSGIAGFFGGNDDAPPPLVQFSLPDTQNRTLDVAGPNGGRTGGQTSNMIAQGSRTYSDRNGEIVRAVKQALLTSPQISDIISEL